VSDESPAEQPSPENIQEPENALPETRLEDLPPVCREAAARAGWTRLMPVQAKAIPYLLAGQDLMVQSRTGSGKTGAFVLPLLSRIDPAKACCQALVLVPTRELARQVASEAEMLAGENGPRVVAVYGGMGFGPQLDAFRRGAHLVVGTPGRVLDHLLRRSLSLAGLETLILDEADRMLSMGFYPDMLRVHEFLPKPKPAAFMFSATYPINVRGLASLFLRKPDMLSLSRDHVHVTDTSHAFYSVPPMDKDRALVRVIEIENPPSAIIFCNTKARCEYVNTVLQRFGYNAGLLTADLGQAQREETLNRVRQGSLRFLVATDLAARGIDIPQLSHVIIYEPPEDPELYIHRAGRTGRAGAAGVALSLVTVMERMDLLRIARQYNMDIEERPLPTDEQVQAAVSERVTAMLEARLRTMDSIQRERMSRFVPLGRSLAESEDESAIIAMLLDDYCQQTLHAAPPSPPPVAAAKPDGEAGAKKRRRRGGRRRSRKS